MDVGELSFPIGHLAWWLGGLGGLVVRGVFLEPGVQIRIHTNPKDQPGSPIAAFCPSTLPPKTATVTEKEQPLGYLGIKGSLAP